MRAIGRLTGAALAAALLALAAVPAAAGATPGTGGVLVVGDSLAELASPYLEADLPGVPLTVNAVGGSNSYQILDLFQQSYEPSQSVIVFDAGTNDNPAYPQILEENLQKVAAAVGERCMVVPTVHGYTVNGVNNDGKNRVVAEFAASRPGTQTPDWAGAVAAHPELMQSDGLHPIQQGAELRAHLIAQGIRGCLAFRAASARASEPALASAPEPIAPVSRMASRQNTILRATTTALLGRAAAELFAAGLGSG